MQSLPSLRGSCLLSLLLVSCQQGYYAKPVPLRPTTRVMGRPAEDLAVAVLSPMCWNGEDEGGRLPPARVYLSPGLYRPEGQDDSHVYFTAPGGVGTFFSDANGQRRLSGNRPGGICMRRDADKEARRNASQYHIQDHAVGVYVDAGDGWVRHLVGCPHFFRTEGKTWRFAGPKEALMPPPAAAASRPPGAPTPPLGTHPLLEPPPPARPLLDRSPATPLLDQPLPGE